MAKSDSPAVIHNASIKCAEPKMVKCITCGFAAKQARIALPGQGNRQYFDIPYDEREGHLVLVTGFKTSVTDYVDIVCFRGRKGLAEAFRKYMGNQPPVSSLPIVPLISVSELPRYYASRKALEEDHVCDGWYHFEPGRTPQEHLADHMWEQLQKQQRELEERREESRRAFEERLQKESSSFNNKLIIAALILGLFQLLAALVAMTRDSLFMKWWLGQ